MTAVAMKFEFDTRQVITSSSNPNVRLAKAVRKGLREDYVFVEGLKLAEEVLRSGLDVIKVFFTKKFATSERSRIVLSGVENHKQIVVSEKVMNLIADTETPQGIVIICERPKKGRELIENRITQKKRLQVRSLVIMLNRISNPSNLGAVLRTAEAVDVDGVILTKGSADPFSPKAVRGSMGACLRLPIWERADFFDAVAWAKSKEMIVTCADVKSTKDYTQIDWTKSRLIVFGSESEGISEDEFRQVEESIKIPMKNSVESLNIAVACGIVLYEAMRATSDF